MKIVITVEEFNPNKGYLEYYLARELAKMGHKVYVFTFDWGKRASRTMLNEGFEVVNVPHFAIIHGYHVPSSSGVAYIDKFIKAKKPDIIHCQPLYSPLSLIFIAWKKFLRYKIVGSIITQQNLFFSPWNAKEKILFSLSKIVIKNYAEKKSEIISAKTKELAKIISRSYDVPLKKIHIIPLGTDPEQFKFDSKKRTLLRTKMGLSKSDVVIVYSGKINTSNGLEVLITALAPIVARNNKVKLLIIGKGKSSYIGHLKKTISDFKIATNVIFHPWVSRTMLPSFYSASDIGVWPGLSSISIIEAASTRLPVIIARYPVETYAIEKGNGFMFEVGNVKDLQRYLEILIDDCELRKKMGRRSRLLVEQKLNWKTITLQYLHAYFSALNKRTHL